MDQILQGLEGVICYLDDILISGKDEAQHLERLDAVLSRLEKCGLKLKKAKCQFMTTEVVYLGHVITEQGIAATPMKVSAIVDAPQPRNVTELRSFLGMLNYYAKFIPDLATLIHPLNELLQSHRPFKWTSECDNAFNAAKAELLAETVLTHYDVTKPLSLSMWCVTVWYRRCTFSYYGEWRRASCRFCLANPYSKWKELFTAAEGSAITSVWSAEVPQVHLWSALHSNNWPQAIVDYIRSQIWGTNTCSC